MYHMRKWVGGRGMGWGGWWMVGDDGQLEVVFQVAGTDIMSRISLDSHFAAV